MLLQERREQGVTELVLREKYRDYPSYNYLITQNNPCDHRGEASLQIMTRIWNEIGDFGHQDKGRIIRILAQAQTLMHTKH